MAAQTGLWHRYAAVAYLAVFLGMVGHATSEFVAVISGIAGPEVSVWRFLIGGLGLVAVALAVPGARDLLTPLREAFWPILGLSLICVAVGYLLFHWALDFATVPQVATMVTASPIYVALVNQWRNRQPITAAKWATGAAAMVGVALLVTDGALDQLAGSGRNLFGMLLVICSSFLIGGFAVLAKPYIERFGALRIITLSMAIAGLGLWGLVGVVWGVWVHPLQLFDRPTGAWVALLTIGLYNTTLTQWLWLGGLAAVPDITRGMYLFFLKPVIAACLAIWILAQPVSALQWLAIIVICGSVVLEATWSRLLGRAAGIRAAYLDPSARMRRLGRGRRR